MGEGGRIHVGGGKDMEGIRMQNRGRRENMLGRVGYGRDKDVEQGKEGR